MPSVILSVAVIFLLTIDIHRNPRRHLMTSKNFAHARAIQSKKHIKKYIKQAAMLSVSLTAFCSVGNCTWWKSCCGSNGDVIEHNTLQPETRQIIHKETIGIELVDSPAIQNFVLLNIHDMINTVNSGIDILNLQIKVLDSMEVFATKANADTAEPSHRALFSEIYQAWLNNIDILIDRLYQIKSNNMALLDYDSSTNTRLGDRDAINTGSVTTNISKDLSLTGFISGGIESASVDTSGGDSGLVNVIVGGQPFGGTIPLGVAGKIQLTSITDHANTITLDITGTGLDSTYKIQKELNTLFQLDIGSPVSMRSASSDLSDSITSIQISAATTPGIYGFSSGYDSIADTITYKISNGAQVWKKTYAAFSASDAQLNKNIRTVTFNNGFTVTTSANNDEQHPAAGMEIINVEAGKHAPLSFQVGDASSNMIDIQFNLATVSSLTLNGTVISEKATAKTAADAIDKALIEVSNMIAKLGGTKAQLNCAKQVY